MNELITFAQPEKVAAVKEIISKSDISAEKTNEIIAYLNESPTILNQLSLAEISKLSVLGIDMSQYMSAVHLNNIKVFVVKFASDSMSRVSKLLDLLNAVEEKYYTAALSSSYLHPKTAGDMIEKIQESITASVNLMMKLTDNETLMNLFIVNMTSINDTISENKAKGYSSSLDILPLESRKKIDKVMSVLADALRETERPASDVIDANYNERKQENE